MRGVAYGPEVCSMLVRMREQGQSLLSRKRGFRAKCSRAGGGDTSKREERDWSPARDDHGIGRAALRRRSNVRFSARVATDRLGRGRQSHDGVSALVRDGHSHLSVAIRRPIQRYEKSQPGELLHLYLNYLPEPDRPRKECEFATVDDFSREAVVSITAGCTSRAATAFLEEVLAQLAYPVQAVLTDKDLVFTMRFAYYSERKTYFEQACHSLGIERRLLRPHAPEFNGKIERILKTVDDECFAVRRPRSSKTRMRVLEEFL